MKVFDPLAYSTTTTVQNPWTYPDFIDLKCIRYQTSLCFFIQSATLIYIIDTSDFTASYISYQMIRQADFQAYKDDGISSLGVTLKSSVREMQAFDYSKQSNDHMLNNNYFGVMSCSGIVFPDLVDQLLVFVSDGTIRRTRVNFSDINQFVIPVINSRSFNQIRESFYILSGNDEGTLGIIEFIQETYVSIGTGFLNLFDITLLKDDFFAAVDAVNYEVHIFEGGSIIYRHYCSDVQTEPTFECLGCNKQYILSSDSSHCSCPSPGYVVDSQGICQQCHSTCQGCSSTGSGGCLSCQPGLSFQAGQCVLECSIGQYLEAGSCVSCPQDLLSGNQFCKNLCDKNCGECTLDTSQLKITCLKCKNNFSIINNICTCSQFDTTQYKFEKDNLCLSLFRINSIAIEEIYFSSKNQILGIFFDQQIKIKDLDLLQIQLKISENKIFEKLKIVKKTLKKSNRILEIKFDFDRTIISNMNLSISWEDPELISNLENSNFYIKQPISTNISYHPLTASSSVMKVLQKLKRYYFYAITAITLLGSVREVVRLLKFFQILEYFTLLNIQSPSNLESFMDNLRGQNIMFFIPNPFSKENNFENCQFFSKLEENGVDCIVVNNIGQFLIPIFLLFLLKLIIFFAKILINWINSPKKTTSFTSFKVKDKGWITNILEYCNSRLNFGLLMKIMTGIQVDINLGLFSLFHSKFLSFKHTSFIFSLTIFVIFTFLYLSIFIVVMLFVNKLDFKKNEKSIALHQELISKNESMTYYLSELDLQNRWSIPYYLFEMIKKTIIPFFLLVFVKFPYTQIIPFIIFTTLTIFIIIIGKPLKNGYDSKLEIVDNSLYLVSLILFLVMHILEGQIAEQFRFYFFGFSIIFCLGVVNLYYVLISGVNVGSMIFHMVVVIWQFVFRRKKQGIILKKEGKIVPKSRISPKRLRVRTSNLGRLAENNPGRIQIMRKSQIKGNKLNLNGKIVKLNGKKRKVRMKKDINS